MTMPDDATKRAIDALITDLLPTFDAVQASKMPLNIYAMRSTMNRVTSLTADKARQDLLIIAALALLIVGQIDKHPAKFPMVDERNQDWD